jgi:cystathionine beta-lyase family protein involved in aluminum resistance
MFFSDGGAWGLECDLLEEHPETFEEVVLRVPPGQVAYQTVHTLSDGTRVYIKVQLSQGKARARSFHISEVE